MDVFEAIFARQSIGKLRPDPVPRELIEQLLAAAVQAPNHYLVRPWRFFVLSGEARMRLGEVLAQSLLERVPEAPPAALEKESQRLLRAPVVIAIAADAPADVRVLEIENISAVAAAIENLLLAATSLGLGAKWRTGNPAYDPNVKAFLGLSPEQPIVGFVYIGYAEFETEPKQRPSFEDRTVWMN